MAETATVHENSSVSLSNNKDHESNINKSNNLQLSAESTSKSNNTIESSKTQTNHFTFNQLSDNMSHTMPKVAIHENRSNINRSRPNSSIPHRNQLSQFTSPTNQPDTQAQLVAFTPPLMSIQLSLPETQIRQRNPYSTRPYMRNEQAYLPPKSKSETTVSQPQYYVDSFASNFSDKSSSNNNKAKTKHVTFQEPDTTNESSTINSNNSGFTPSSSNGWNWNGPPSNRIFPVYMHPTPRSFNRYNHPNDYYPHNEFYPPYSNMMMNPRFTARPRGINMMPMAPPVWTPPPYYPNQPVPYGAHQYRPRQLYDPNQPKLPSTTESHDSSKVLRHIVPKNKKKTKQTDSSDNSTVSTPEPISHPITILRKPSTDVEIPTPSVENQPAVPSAKEPQQQPITSSKEEQTITPSDTASEEQQSSSITSSDVLSEVQPTTMASSEVQSATTTSFEVQSTPIASPEIQSTTIASTEVQPTTTASSDVQPPNVTSSEVQPPTVTSCEIQSTPVASSEIQSTTAASTEDQSESNPTISLPSHELLSILQSANCISSLNEYSQQKKFPLNYEFSSISPSSFTCTISINGRQFPTSSSCASKNEAQKLACDQAVRILYRESCSIEQSSLEFSSKHDYIAHRSVSSFQDLNVNELLLGRKTLACMLMITDQQFAQARVISIATGNSCLDETNLSYADDGTALHDCHAEILARRGLIKYLFEQIKQSRDQQSSIFEYNSTTNKYQLRDNITFHMYISALPCGNASLNIPSNSIRYKQGQKEGTLIASTSSIKYPVKSCSDKIYRWNILGIQGGLLINLLTKPIYLQTITIACETTFDRNRVNYTLCERFKEHFHSLPSPFLFHMPDIDCPKAKSFQQERQVAKLQTNAFAWNITQPSRTELLEPMTGKLKNDRSISSLTKQNLLKDFLNIHQENSLTYYQAKQLHPTYIIVKNLISTAFQSESSDENISWISKSDQLEQFSNQ